MPPNTTAPSMSQEERYSKISELLNTRKAIEADLKRNQIIGKCILGLMLVSFILLFVTRCEINIKIINPSEISASDTVAGNVISKMLKPNE